MPIPQDVDPKNIVDAVIKSYVNGLNEMLQQETDMQAKANGHQHVNRVAHAWNKLLERLAEQ